ncbi:MAG: hypothetical protein ACRDRN_01855 [Sciscionella sp.]
MAGGYQASSDAMAAVSKNIGDDVHNLQQKLKDIAPTQLAAADFGQAHQAHQSAYKTAVDEYGKGAKGMCSTLSSFASQIGGAGGTYADNESNTGGELRNSGGQ